MNHTINKIRDQVFKNVHSNNLIYNTCWEDPRCDRELLTFASSSKIVMITSAGCNALDYLLDNPQVIHSIDMNPRQNALLALKMAVFKYGTYTDLWYLFGEGHHPEAVDFYANIIRKHLPGYAQSFWDRNIVHFTKKSFYFFGTSGTFAWLFNQYINLRPKLRGLMNQLLEAKSVEEQAKLYTITEPKVITPFIKWLMSRHITLTLLGVPRAQRELISEAYPGGMAGFLTDAMRHIFSELPIQDNYFWRLYLKGRYTQECCPAYLEAEHFETIKARVDNIKIHTTTISNFLKQNPNQYSHYILLDHQDWLATHDVEALEEEWQLILQNSEPGSKILSRSAAVRVDFFPDFVNEALEYEQELTKKLHKEDRVGTYGSVTLGIVKNGQVSSN